MRRSATGPNSDNWNTLQPDDLDCYICVRNMYLWRVGIVLGSLLIFKGGNA